jgi:hypothetical protein
MMIRRMQGEMEGWLVRWRDEWKDGGVMSKMEG